MELEKVNDRTYWLYEGNEAYALIELLKENHWSIGLDKSRFYFWGTFEEMRDAALNKFNS